MREIEEEHFELARHRRPFALGGLVKTPHIPPRLTSQQSCTTVCRTLIYGSCASVPRVRPRLGYLLQVLRPWQPRPGAVLSRTAGLCCRGVGQESRTRKSRLRLHRSRLSRGALGQSKWLRCNRNAPFGLNDSDTSRRKRNQFVIAEGEKSMPKTGA